MSDEMATIAAGELIEWLHGTIRPRLDGMMDSVRRRFPDVPIYSYEGPLGSLTEFQAQEVGFEAILPAGNCIARPSRWRI